MKSLVVSYDGARIGSGSGSTSQQSSGIGALSWQGLAAISAMLSIPTIGQSADIMAGPPQPKVAGVAKSRTPIHGAMM
jgi:hypothetical protein